MSKVKKLLAIVLSLAMIMGMSLTTFAADNIIGNSDDVGTITVRGIEDPNLTVMAYPIAMAQYDSVTDVFTGYSNPYNIADITNPTQQELENIRDNPTEGGGFRLDYDSTTNTYYKENQKVGMYLIVVPSNNSTTYNVAVASIKYSSNGTNNIIDPGELTMATTIVEPATWVKKNVKVEVDKTVNSVSGTTANVGDTLNYSVTISPIPKYSGEYPKLMVTDILSEGLSYNNDLKVTIDRKELVVGTDYTVSFNEESRTIVVNFVVGDQNPAYMLNDYAGKDAVITYTATLNDNAKLNGGENSNTVTLDYTRDSTVDGDDDDDNDTTHTYTFDIDGKTVGSLTSNIINKYGEEKEQGTDENLPLKDAEFTLYKSDGSTVYTNNVFNGTTTTDVNGQIKITGLAEGTYYLKETKAPSGYSVNTHPYKIVIDANLDDITGELTSWTITIDGHATSTFTMNSGTAVITEKEETNIQNTKLSSLPSTGGIGTTIFTIGGCVIMIAAAGLYFASRRRQENK